VGEFWRRGATEAELRISYKVETLKYLTLYNSWKYTYWRVKRVDICSDLVVTSDKNAKHRQL
jgi:hypothetical protein